MLGWCRITKHHMLHWFMDTDLGVTQKILIWVNTSGVFFMSKLLLRMMFSSDFLTQGPFHEATVLWKSICNFFCIFAAFKCSSLSNKLICLMNDWKQMINQFWFWKAEFSSPPGLSTTKPIEPRNDLCRTCLAKRGKLKCLKRIQQRNKFIGIYKSGKGCKSIFKDLGLQWTTMRANLEQWWTFPVVDHSKLLQEGINDSSTRSPNNPELWYYHIEQFSGENFNNQVTAEEQALCDGE